MYPKIWMQAKAAMESGALVSDEIVIGILKDRIAQDDCAKGFILDGFPRTVYQAEKLDEFLAENGQKLSKVIDLEVGDEELIKRISGRRVCKDCGATYTEKLPIVNIPDGAPIIVIESNRKERTLWKKQFISRQMMWK